MARTEQEGNITISVLDRLIEPQGSERADSPSSHGQSLRQLKAALKRDLEWLLNTRRDPDSAPEGVEELERSLYNYGLPDIAGMHVRSTADQNRLLRLIESAIAIFEPRIQNPTVLLEPMAGSTHILRFHIQGLLRVDPAPEKIAFDTILELTSGKYEVQKE